METKFLEKSEKVGEIATSGGMSLGKVLKAAFGNPADQSRIKGFIKSWLLWTAASWIISGIENGQFARWFKKKS